MRCSASALLLVVGFGPVAVWDGQGGPLDEGLTQELRTLQAPVHPGLVAAALGDRSDTGILLDLVGTGVALTLFAECGQQPWRERGTGAGQRAEQRVVRQRRSELGDLLLVALDRFEQRAQLRDEDFDQQ